MECERRRRRTGMESEGRTSCCHRWKRERKLFFIHTSRHSAMTLRHICDEGLYQTFHSDTLCSYNIATSLSHTSNPTPPPHFCTLLPLPRYPHNRPFRWLVEHPCTRLRGAQLRQLRSRSLREQEGTEREGGQEPLGQGDVPTYSFTRPVLIFFHRSNRT